MCYDQVLFINDVFVIQFLFVVEDFYQGRFIGVVVFDEVDVFVIFNMQFGIIQQWCIVEGKSGVVYINQ